MFGLQGLLLLSGLHLLIASTNWLEIHGGGYYPVDIGLAERYNLLSLVLFAFLSANRFNRSKLS